jgi:uncharacterized protein YjbJ (UPF0337 family)
MMMNKHSVQGKWNEIRGEIQKAWGKLTNDELDQAKGDVKSIGGLIEQRYGEKQEQYGRRLSDIFERFEEKKDRAVEDVKDRLKQ